MTFTEQLTETLNRFKAEFVSVDPDWSALENYIPEPWWGGFMFMGRSTDFNVGGQTIYLYKHGVTRNYLNIDSAGKFYKYTGKGYAEITKDEAIKHVYDGIERMNASPTTIYDAAYKPERIQALANMGYTVIG